MLKEDTWFVKILRKHDLSATQFRKTSMLYQSHRSLPEHNYISSLPMKKNVEHCLTHIHNSLWLRLGLHSFELQQLPKPYQILLLNAGRFFQLFCRLHYDFPILLYDRFKALFLSLLEKINEDFAEVIILKRIFESNKPQHH